MHVAKSSGLGRGLGDLFATTEARTEKEQVQDAVATAEKVVEARLDAERKAAEEAERVAAVEEARAVAERAAREAEAAEAAGAPMDFGEDDLRISSEAIADSIDVKFSLAEHEIVERAPRKPVSAPVESAQVAQQPVAIPLRDGAIADISLDYLDPNPYQPRLKYKQEPLEELAASIAQEGVIQPITVRPLPNGRYQIIAGERRFRASQMAGMRTIPAYIREAQDRDMGQYALVENLQREDLNPIEAAVGYKNLMKAQNLTQAELAQLLCKGRSTIANTLRLLDLPEDLQEMIYNEQLTEGHARAIQAVPTEEGRKKLAEKVIAENLSVRATESLARFMCGRPAAKEGDAPERATVPAAFKVMARTLRDRLGTNVKVKNSGGKNKLEIEFTDAEDLERICRQIVAAE